MRHFPDWLQAFVDYASYGEAPKHLYFWTGVSTLAGVLRRRVWIPQFFYTWYPNFYIVLVAPPAVVSKSTTANIGMALLRQVPGINFGPDSTTSQALIGAFANATEQFEYDGTFVPQSALTIASSELGNLLHTEDTAMIDLLVDLWDGRDVFEKITKMSGNDTVQAPWVNLIACTTPAWIERNVPEYMIGGGLISRMIFVYADKKEKLVAYPIDHLPANHKETQAKLISDLSHVAQTLCGPYVISPTAKAWGNEWYKVHNANRPPGLDDDRFGGYLQRKQTHIHKLAMVLAASRTDDLVIEAEDLATAATMITALESQMPQVFRRIGRSENSVQSERFLAYCKNRKELEYREAYRYIHAHFPAFRDFEDMVKGGIFSGQIRLEQRGGSHWLVWTGGD